MNMHTYPPGGPSPANSLFAILPTAIAPKSFKAALADEIERMIAMLDDLDGDADLEDCHDQEASDLAGTTIDREADDSDDEPSLGSLGGTA